MIEFDDAGNGCPILGEVFVARRVETGENYKCFVEYNQKIRKRAISKSLREILKEINPKKDEKIVLCRGNIFDSFHRYLKEKKYNVERGKIEGETNDLAEEFMINKLREIGLPESINAYNRDFAQFNTFVTTWYLSSYTGEKNLLKSNNHLYKDRMQIINNIYKYPNLLNILFNSKENYIKN